MEQLPFGNTGLKVSPVGFGGAPIGFLKTDQQKVGRILNLLLDSGANVIDTAASYEGSEELIAHTVGHRRDEFVLVSKCGSEVPQATGKAWSAELIKNTVDASLRRLKTDRLDVMLLHSCDLETLRKGEALGALVDARNAGKIRHAGYSGDNETAAWAAQQPDVAVIETSISFVDQNNIETTLPVTRRRNLGVLAKRPIGNSCWRTLDQFHRFYPDYVRPYRERFEKMGLRPKDLGFKGELDWPEIALRFTLSQAGVHTAIIGTTNPDNTRANLAAANKGPLPPGVIEQIRVAFTRTAAGKWPGLT